MNIEKLITLTLVLALVAGLAGCGAQPAKTVTETQAVTQTETTTAIPATVTFGVIVVGLFIAFIVRRKGRKVRIKKDINVKTP